MTVQILVLAKTPVPGRVKTRLCPPCTPEQAATIAAAAIADTLDAVDASRASARTLVADGEFEPRPGWTLVSQCQGGLDERLAHAFATTAKQRLASLLIGMDTPQVTPAQLDEGLRALDRADAAFAPALDGGYWAIGLRRPDAAVFRDVPMSVPTTAKVQRARLAELELATVELPALVDVDTIGDARRVAAAAPLTRFARALERVAP